MRGIHPLDKVFKDDREISRLREKLPYLFKIAEIEVSKGGKTGMEVGTLRENIIIAYFMTVFGEEYIDTNIPINNSEIDFYLIYKDDKIPISVKTKTGKGLSGVKLVWTVDWESVEKFCENYKPFADILFIQVVYGGEGVFCYIPVDIQMDVFHRLGADYLKKPKRGTNPRGVEISSKALKYCIEETPYKFKIDWVLQEGLTYTPYRRWIELWKE